MRTTVNIGKLKRMNKGTEEEKPGITLLMNACGPTKTEPIGAPIPFDRHSDKLSTQEEYSRNDTPDATLGRRVYFKNKAHQ